MLLFYMCMLAGVITVDGFAVAPTAPRLCFGHQGWRIASTAAKLAVASPVMKRGNLIGSRACETNDVDSQSVQPPNFNPEKFVFGPGKSRYEQFYTKQGVSDDAIDASAATLPSTQGDESGTNPFFVGYEDDVLQSLWNVHKTNYGERSADSSDEEKLPAAGPAMGGLHELVMGIVEEQDSKKE